MSSDGIARPGDIYWNINKDQLYKRGANATTWTILQTVTSTGNIEFNGGSNPNIKITDGTTVRVIIGSL